MAGYKINMQKKKLLSRSLIFKSLVPDSSRIYFIAKYRVTSNNMELWEGANIQVNENVLGSWMRKPS